MNEWPVLGSWKVVSNGGLWVFATGLPLESARTTWAPMTTRPLLVFCTRGHFVRSNKVSPKRHDYVIAIPQPASLVFVAMRGDAERRRASRSGERPAERLPFRPLVADIVGPIHAVTG